MHWRKVGEGGRRREGGSRGRAGVGGAGAGRGWWC